MFKLSAIKKYGNKLLPLLQKRYGEQFFYTASQIRATIYQCNFNPKYLPLGYLLFIDPALLIQLIQKEFPNICITRYKKEMRDYLDAHKYYGYLKSLTL